MALLPRRLNARITLVVSCILLATGATSGWLVARQQVASLLDAMHQRTAVTVRHLADTGTRLLLVEDYAELENYLIKSLEQPDMQHLVVTEPDGAIIWDVSHGPDGKPKSRAAGGRLAVPTTAVGSLRMEGDSLVAWHPIEAARLLGWVRAEFSLASIRKAEGDIWQSMMLMAMLWAAGSAGLIIVLLQPIALAIGRMADFARQLDAHKGDQLTVADDIAEIASLGDALNEASVGLQTTEQQLLDERERLREAEERYRTFADFTYDWEVWAAPDGSFRYVSPSCERVTGYTAAEFVADPELMLRVVVPEDRSLFEAHLMAVRSSGVAECTTEFRIRTRGGETRWIEHVCHAVVREDGTYLGRRASNRDITERRYAEQEIRKLNIELEDRVRCRTAELEAANAELTRARNAADAANLAKSAFLANMSHELRTPLNAILGFAQLMERDQAMPAHERQNLQTINRSGHHLLALINDVLEISRIEAGRITLTNEAFELPAVIAAVEEMIRVRADAKGLRLLVEVAPGLPGWVMGDAHHLRQVLINLLGNAAKYTDQGRIGLQVALAGERVRFSVSDTGPGIAAEDQESIFQPFYQTTAGAAKGEGTGLGLTISREFVRLMGGELRVASEPGRGAEFWFEIPLPATVPAPSAAQGGRVVGIAAGQAIPRILVAEDQPDNRALLLSLLKSVGFAVRVVDNGQQAVDTFLAWQPQFIWMDMRMPVMDGYEATRAIRALPGGKAVRIVALTASAFREDRDAIIAAGCDDMVRKPIDESVLFAVMGRLLGLRFRYEETPPVAPAATANGDLSGLPEPLRRELAAAARTLDGEAVAAIVARLRNAHGDAATAIAALAENYRFEDLERLCGPNG